MSKRTLVWQIVLAIAPIFITYAVPGNIVGTCLSAVSAAALCLITYISYSRTEWSCTTCVGLILIVYVLYRINIFSVALAAGISVEQLRPVCGGTALFLTFAALAAIVYITKPRLLTCIWTEFDADVVPFSWDGETLKIVTIEGERAVPTSAIRFHRSLFGVHMLEGKGLWDIYLPPRLYKENAEQIAEIKRTRISG